MGTTYAQNGNLIGRVLDNNGPIPAVNILIMDTGIGAVTDMNGYYRLANITPGQYSVRYSSVGYATIFKDVTIYGNKTVEINILLEEQAIQYQDVEVFGTEIRDVSDTETSFLDINPRNAKVLPGAGEDVLRTLQSLPGVLAPNDFSSQLVVRGSGPDQNLIIIDNVEIFNPYRLYGAISMFNPDATDDIKLITGGFPAKYGDRLSAVLDVTSREGNTNHALGGSLNASILSANLVLEGKNPFGIKGGWLVSSRRTYYDLIIEPFAKNAGLVEDDVTFPNFYDVQGKFVIGPFNGHKIIATGIYSADGVDVVSGDDRPTPDSISVNNLTRNDIVSLSWHFAPNTKILNKVIVSWYRNTGYTGFDSKILDPSLNRDAFKDAVPDTLSGYLLNLRFDNDFTFRKYAIDDKFTYLWGDNTFEAGFGMDIMQTTLEFNFEFDEQLEAIFQNNPNVRSAFDDLQDVRKYNRYRAYVQNKFKVTDWLYIHPSLRYDYYENLHKYYLAPRIATSFALDAVTTVRGVWGRYYQSPGYEKLRDQGLLIDLSDTYTRQLDAEQSTHYVLSIERWLNNEWNLTLEGYYKDFEKLIIPERVDGSRYYSEQIPGRDQSKVSGWTRPVAFKTDSATQIPLNDSFGEAYGFEVLLAKKNREGYSRLNGWISYALAWANRYEYGDLIPFRFDQRHTVNVVLDYQYDDTWNFGLRWQYGSGYPYTTPIGIKPRIIMTDADGDLIPETPSIATRSSNSDPGSREVIFDINYGENRKYNTRKPLYHRLDLRITAAVEVWDLPWNFYLDIINVYNHDNVISYSYYLDENNELASRKNTMFPIIPTLGFSVRF